MHADRSAPGTDALERRDGLHLVTRQREVEHGQVFPHALLAHRRALVEKCGKPAGTIRITSTEHAARSPIWPRLLPCACLEPHAG